VGSESKLHTIRDGIRITRTIVGLIMRERPLQFFSAIATLLFMIALALGVPVIAEFMATGLVPRFPTAILSASLVLLSFLLLTCGLILDSVSLGRREAKRICFLSYPSPIALQARLPTPTCEFPDGHSATSGGSGRSATDAGLLHSTPSRVVHTTNIWTVPRRLSRD
jgi:hypothetical protein